MKCFVVMPFAIQDVYQNAIKPACHEAGWEVLRADEIILPGNIIKDIIRQIDSANLVIADLTGRNPNVFYELGVAHSLSKNVLMICQSISDDVPFDLRPYRVISYNSSFSGITALRTSLLGMLGQLAASLPQPHNPVTDFLGARNEIQRSAEARSTIPKLPEFEDAIGRLDRLVVLNTRAILIAFELRKDPPTFSLETEYLGRIDELLSSSLVDSNLRDRLAPRLNEIMDSLTDEEETYETRSKRNEAFFRELRLALREPIREAAKQLVQLDISLRPVVYQFYTELMDEKAAHYHGWHVCSEINSIFVRQRNSDVVPILIEMILREASPASNTWVDNCINTGRRLLGRREFDQIVDSAAGYEFMKELHEQKRENEARWARERELERLTRRD